MAANIAAASAVLRVMEGMYGKTGVVDLAASQGDGFIDKLVADNQATVMKVFDTIDDVAGSTIARIKRRRGLR